ncbi:MAG: MFS transporter [Pseudomonadota bacterium]
MTAPSRPRIDPALLVIAAGVSAAFHVGKLPPALPALQDSLGIGLVEAGFLISLVQLAGMTLGLIAGLAADGLGLRRAFVAGLAVLCAASLAAGFVHSASPMLALRALEGVGFLLVATTAPGLIRRLVPPERLSPRLGLWGCYMPLGTALALLAGPAWVAAWGWPSWWWLASVLSGGFALAVLAWVPPDPAQAQTAAGVGVGRRWAPRLWQTLGAPGPWLISVTFAAYAAQWLAVIGFLPTVYAQAGVSGPRAGVATALVAAVNIVGNIASGRLLQRGVAPGRLLNTGFIAMALGSLLAFTPIFPAGSVAAVAVPYAAVLCFSMVGGLIPGTLFSLAVRLAPGADTVSTTVGWMQQWSAIGQFAGPPLVAWVASQVGGWGASGGVTAAFALAGLVLAWAIGRLPAAAGPAWRA